MRRGGILMGRKKGVGGRVGEVGGQPTDKIKKRGVLFAFCMHAEPKE